MKCNHLLKLVALKNKNWGLWVHWVSKADPSLPEQAQALLGLDFEFFIWHPAPGPVPL